MNIVRAIITIISCLAFANINAQIRDFSGIWVLKERTSLSGPNYGNGLPKLMQINLGKDSISLSRTYEGTSDYTINESLALNGTPTEVLRTTSKRKSVLRAGGKNTFLIEVTYRDINTGKPTSADFIENWSVSDKQLTVEKTAKEADGSIWSMKGVYKQTTAQEMATGKGIQFTENLSWEEVKTKANTEHKFIFVDCFATWCMPCKKMEKEIFPMNIVGKEMNEHFISVQVQMDTTKKDGDKVQAWYSTAHEFLTKYNLVGYPTFLFFDSNGNIVHKGLGTYNAEEFIFLLKKARNPNEQYYNLLNSYKAGERDNEKMYSLIKAANALGETKQAEEVLVAYKNNYLNRLPLDSLLSEKYLKLGNDFQEKLIRVDGSKGVFFKLLYEKGKEVDAILGAPGFSAFHVNGIITREEIENKIYINGKPVANVQWDKIKSSIEEKYAKVSSDKLVLDARIRYCQVKKDWSNQIKYFVQKVEKYGPLSLGDADGQGSDNAIVSVLLPHCDDNQILNKAIGWMEQIIHSNAYVYPVAMVYGNYGGILYKAGKTKEGIEAFEKQISAIGYKGPGDLDMDPRFKPKINYLERMKRGEKIDSTWKPNIFN